MSACIAWLLLSLFHAAVQAPAVFFSTEALAVPGLFSGHRHPSAGISILVELGGTHMRGATLNDEGRLSFFPTHSMPPKALGSEVLLKHMVRFVTRNAGPAQHVLVATPGIVREDGFIELANNLALTEVHLRDELIARLGTFWARAPRVRVVNDLVAAGWGEREASADKADFLYLNLGTGLSAARVSALEVVSLELGRWPYRQGTLEEHYQALRDRRDWEALAEMLVEPVQQMVLHQNVQTIHAGGSVITGSLPIANLLRARLLGNIRLLISKVPEESRGVRGLRYLHQHAA